MSIIQVVLTSFLSLTVLFLLTKLSGNKQVSQLTMFDYINGISIGSIAAELATEIEEPLKPLTAMIVFGLVTCLFSLLCSRCLKIRRVIFGKSKVLYRNGKIYRRNLSVARLDMSEFLMQCRTAGYFDLREISLAVMEPSGKISFLPTAATRPVNPTDLSLPVSPSVVPVTVITDGRVLSDNLRAIGKDERWLLAKLKENGFASHRSVLLGLAAADGTSAFFGENQCGPDNDIFQ